MPTSADINFYFRENKSYYIAFFMCLIFGIIVGMFVVFSSDTYLDLATSSDKVLFSIINGSSGVGELFWSQLLSFIFPMLIIFLLNLNFYLGLISYIVIAYQSMLFVMSMSSVISIYGISGILNAIFVMLPINLIYLCILIFFGVTCSRRSKEADRYKYFAYGLGDDSFLLKIAIGLISVILLSVLATIIYPLILKNANFIIF